MFTTLFFKKNVSIKTKTQECKLEQNRKDIKNMCFWKLKKSHKISKRKNEKSKNFYF